MLNHGYAYRAQIGAESDRRTLLAHLTTTYRHSTKQEWADRLARGEIEVDGTITRSDAILRAGQTLVWRRPPWDEPDVPLHYELLHEDEAIVVVAKPCGLPTMPAGGFLQHTLLTLVRADYGHVTPLHRLGRHTSGVVLFARTPAAASFLARAWRRHEIKKHYVALGGGVASFERLEINTPIGRVPHPTLEFVYAASADGKPSHSVASVIERRADSTLFDVQITTGRPHQIRIHLAAAGHPLVGDPLYEIGGGIKTHAPGLPGDGGYLLHARRLEFVHPTSGEPMQIDAPLWGGAKAHALHNT